MRTGAVIVAAGMSSRMGDFKPMLKIGAISMVQRVIANYQQAGVFPIVLVTGYCGDELKKHVAGTGVICVHHEAYAATEMLDSAKLGFSYIADKCDRTFFSPVDVPLFTVNTAAKLMRADAAVVKPVHKGRHGHPILLFARVLPELLSAEAEGGLRRVIDAVCGGNIATVEVDDDSRAMYFDQAKYGVYVRMALILTILEEEKSSETLVGKVYSNVRCDNPKCITNHEEYLPKSFRSCGDETLLVCEYCDERKLI